MSGTPTFTTHYRSYLSALLILTITLGYWIGYSNNHTSPRIPKAILLESEFPIYFPDPIPKGYRYVDKSARYNQNIFFYSIGNDGKIIRVTQQPKPTRNLMLDSLVGLSQFQTELGTVYMGKVGANPIAILMTNTTLLNISADPSVPDNTLSEMISNFKPLVK